MLDETIQLGAADLCVSRLGMGGCPLGGHGWGDDFDAREAVAAVRCALELGVTFFDTADVYGLGRSEQLLADALGADRFKVTVATKFGVAWDDSGRTWKDISPARVTRALEGSLRRLRVDCIDLYYIHWPDGTTPLAAALDVLERCREQGKIRAIGLSNFSNDDVVAASQIAPIAALQLQYSLVDRVVAEAASSAVTTLGVPLVTWGSLAQGLLTGKFDANSSFRATDRRSRYANFQGSKFAANLQLLEKLTDVARRVGKTPAQVAMRWLLQSPGVGAVLFGAKRPAQIEENCGAAGWQLPEADYLALAQASEVIMPAERRLAS
jgi:myo-inositol catabolism protein IolS